MAFYKNDKAYVTCDEWEDKAGYVKYTGKFKVGSREFSITINDGVRPHKISYGKRAGEMSDAMYCVISEVDSYEKRKQNYKKGL